MSGILRTARCELRLASGETVGIWYLQFVEPAKPEVWYLDSLVARGGYLVPDDSTWFINDEPVERPAA